MVTKLPTLGARGSGKAPAAPGGVWSRGRVARGGGSTRVRGQARERQASACALSRAGVGLLGRPWSIEPVVGHRGPPRGGGSAGSRGRAPRRRPPPRRRRSRGCPTAPGTDGTHHAVDVRGRAAAPAHEVVVVVGHAALEARGVPGGLDPTHEPGVDAGGQHVVDGLGGDRAELGPHPGADGVGRGVRVSASQASTARRGAVTRSPASRRATTAGSAAGSGRARSRRGGSRQASSWRRRDSPVLWNQSSCRTNRALIPLRL